MISRIYQFKSVSLIFPVTRGVVQTSAALVRSCQKIILLKHMHGKSLNSVIIARRSLMKRSWVEEKRRNQLLITNSIYSTHSWVLWNKQSLDERVPLPIMYTTSCFRHMVCRLIITFFVIRTLKVDLFLQKNINLSG